MISNEETLANSIETVDKNGIEINSIRIHLSLIKKENSKLKETNSKLRGQIKSMRVTKRGATSSVISVGTVFRSKALCAPINFSKVRCADIVLGFLALCFSTGGIIVALFYSHGTEIFMLLILLILFLNTDYVIFEMVRANIASTISHTLAQRFHPVSYYTAISISFLIYYCIGLIVSAYDHQFINSTGWWYVTFSVFSLVAASLVLIFPISFRSPKSPESLGMIPIDFYQGEIVPKDFAVLPLHKMTSHTFTNIITEREKKDDGIEDNLPDIEMNLDTGKFTANNFSDYVEDEDELFETDNVFIRALPLFYEGAISQFASDIVHQGSFVVAIVLGVVVQCDHLYNLPSGCYDDVPVGDCNDVFAWWWYKLYLYICIICCVGSVFLFSLMRNRVIIVDGRWHLVTEIFCLYFLIMGLLYQTFGYTYLVANFKIG